MKFEELLHIGVRNVVLDDTGIDLTDEQVEEILQDPHLGGQVKQWGTTDTEVRSQLSNFLSQRIVGRPWPMYRDGQPAYDSFIAELQTKAPEKGYTFKP